MEKDNLHALQPGYMLYEYRIDALLGEGGFGLTYLGFDTHLHKKVAIKEFFPTDHSIRRGEISVCPKSTRSERDYKWGLQKFVDEARTLAKLDSPHIVRINRYLERNGTAYIIMDFCQGGSLKDKLFPGQQEMHNGPAMVMPEQEVRSLLLKLSKGLEVAHQQGIYHRDINPANIMFNGVGEPVLIDFGAAKYEFSERTRSVHAVITPGYSPMEQYSKKTQVGPQIDIYSLGAVGFTCLKGEKPDDAADRVMNDDLDKLASKRNASAFLHALDKALELRAVDRPQTLSAWLDTWQGEVPTEVLNAAPIEPQVTESLSSELPKHERSEKHQEILPEREASKSKTVVWTVFFMLLLVGGVIAAAVYLGFIDIKLPVEQSEEQSTRTSPENFAQTKPEIEEKDKAVYQHLEKSIKVASASETDGEDTSSREQPAEVADETEAATASEQSDKGSDVTPPETVASHDTQATPDEIDSVLLGNETVVQSELIARNETQVSEQIAESLESTDDERDEAPVPVEQEIAQSRQAPVQQEFVLLDRSQLNEPINVYSDRKVEVLSPRTYSANYRHVVYIRNMGNTVAPIHAQAQIGDAPKVELGAIGQAKAGAITDVGSALIRALLRHGLTDTELTLTLTVMAPENLITIDKSALKKREHIRKTAMTVDTQVTFSDQIDGHANGPVMTVIHAGSFVMGCSNTRGDCIDNESFRLTVTHGHPFSISETEITIGQWLECVKRQGCKAESVRIDTNRLHPEQPIIRVTASEIDLYLTWLSSVTGQRYRLPSESEWAYAARAGTVTNRHWGDDITCRHANYAYETELGNPVKCPSFNGSAPVASYSPNAFGLFDMLGNVAELVADCYVLASEGAPESEQTATTQSALTVPVPFDGSAVIRTACQTRHIRGGGWNDWAQDIRVTKRDFVWAGEPGNFGFRVVRSYRGQ